MSRKKAQPHAWYVGIPVVGAVFSFIASLFGCGSRGDDTEEQHFFDCEAALPTSHPSSATPAPAQASKTDGRSSNTDGKNRRQLEFSSQATQRRSHCGELDVDGELLRESSVKEAPGRLTHRTLSDTNLISGMCGERRLSRGRSHIDIDRSCSRERPATSRRGSSKPSLESMMSQPGEEELSVGLSAVLAHGPAQPPLVTGGGPLRDMVQV